MNCTVVFGRLVAYYYYESGYREDEIRTNDATRSYSTGLYTRE